MPSIGEPDAFEVIDAKSSRGSVTATNGVLVCDFGNLQMGEGATVDLVVRSLKPGRLIHVTAVRTADADLNVANNFALTWTQVVSPTELLVRQIATDECEILWSSDALGLRLAVE